MSGAKTERAIKLITKALKEQYGDAGAAELVGSLVEAFASDTRQARAASGGVHRGPAAGGELCAHIVAREAAALLNAPGELFDQHLRLDLSISAADPAHLNQQLSQIRDGLSIALAHQSARRRAH